MVENLRQLTIHGLLRVKVCVSCGTVMTYSCWDVTRLEQTDFYGVYCPDCNTFLKSKPFTDEESEIDYEDFYKN